MGGKRRAGRVREVRRREDGGRESVSSLEKGAILITTWYSTSFSLITRGSLEVSWEGPWLFSSLDWGVEGGEGNFVPIVTQSIGAFPLRGLATPTQCSPLGDNNLVRSGAPTSTWHRENRL